MTLLVYLLTAYLVVPAGWRFYARRHPPLPGIPRITHTGNGIAGDPLNVALVGSEAEVQSAMLAAHWFPADPITLRSSLRIAAGTVLRRPYDTAPVSNLYLFGRKEDLAFEQSVGDDPRRRHHVRFWRAGMLESLGRPLWVGSATFDIRVGFSHRTGQITHHVDADIDRERNKLLDDLRTAGQLVDLYWLNGFQTHREGRNGGGDRYVTDGNLPIAVLPVRADLAQTERK
ncbi:MAG: LssY C-terminal domain-containing protein [Gemmataceae bacterium]